VHTLTHLKDNQHWPDCWLDCQHNHLPRETDSPLEKEDRTKSQLPMWLSCLPPAFTARLIRRLFNNYPITKACRHDDTLS